MRAAAGLPTPRAATLSRAVAPHPLHPRLVAGLAPAALRLSCVVGRRGPLRAQAATAYRRHPLPKRLPSGGSAGALVDHVPRAATRRHRSVIRATHAPRGEQRRTRRTARLRYPSWHTSSSTTCCAGQPTATADHLPKPLRFVWEPAEEDPAKMIGGSADRRR